jgi:hypothetical protein
MLLFIDINQTSTLSLAGADLTIHLLPNGDDTTSQTTLQGHPMLTTPSIVSRFGVPKNILKFRFGH